MLNPKGEKVGSYVNYGPHGTAIRFRDMGLEDVAIDFIVNNRYDMAEEEESMPKIAITKWLLKEWKEMLRCNPQCTFIGEVYWKDGKGDRRQRAYEKLGFKSLGGDIMKRLPE